MTIKSIDKNETYVATIKLYSNGDSDNVAVSMEISHEIGEDFEGVVPASYGVARELVMNLRRNAQMFPAQDNEDGEPETAEEQVKRLLDQADAADEVVNAVIH